MSFSDGEQQLSGFQVFTTGTIGGPETLAYDNGGVQYGDGVFNITFQPERAVASVIIRRPIIMVLCEVEVYDCEFSRLFFFLYLLFGCVYF